MYWTEASRSNNAVKFSDRQDKKLSFRVTDYLGKSLKITQGPSRSLELAQFDRSHDGSYWRSIVTMAISCTISQIKRDTVLVKNRDFFHIPYIPRPRRLRLITWLCDLDLWPWRSWRLWLMRVVIIRVPSLKFVGLAVRKLWRTMSMCVSINGSGDLELWSFDLETGMSVASKVGNLRSEFGHIRPLVSPLIRYVRDGLTKLNAYCLLSYGRGHNNGDKCATSEHAVYFTNYRFWAWVHPVSETHYWAMHIRMSFLADSCV